MHKGTLSRASAIQVLDHLVSKGIARQRARMLDDFTKTFSPTGLAEWEDEGTKLRCRIFWKSVDDWAALVSKLSTLASALFKTIHQPPWYVVHIMSAQIASSIQGV